MGASIAGVPDVTGDGLEDLALGLPAAIGGRGEAWIFSGAFSGAMTTDEAVAHLMVETAGGGAAIGAVIASGGDLDGDGVAELLVGQYGDTRGAVYVLSPPLLGDVALDDYPTITADADEHIGARALGADDLTGDGARDLVVADYGSFSDGGGAYIVPGPIDGDALTTNVVGHVRGAGGSRSGVGLDAGDLDGDGVAELVLGAPGGDVGAVVVLQGPIESFLTTGDAAWAFSSDGDDDQLGARVALHDTDGDGLPNVLVSAPGSDLGAVEGGAVYALGLPGAPDASTLEVHARLAGARSTERAGESLALVDGDGDGAVELAIGAPGYGGDAGVVYLVIDDGAWSGTISLDAADGRLLGGPGDRAGLGLTAADIDADGDTDLFIGAPGRDEMATGGGAVYGVRAAP
jgi:hypothetical protein